MPKIMRINAKLKEVKYTATMLPSLSAFDIAELADGQFGGGACIVRDGDNKWGFSQWVSPKRTRSYPYARVYDTLQMTNRVTLIPFCKDEGSDGDRDFLQWDTVSLMSLLNVYVIVGYYTTAEKNTRPQQIHKQKITRQIYDYKYVQEMFTRIRDYRSGALHWNLSQLEKANLLHVAKLARQHYEQIGKTLKIKLHSFDTFDKRIKTLSTNVDNFREQSRMQSGQAQQRELATVQPKERVGRGGKIAVSLRNLLGGEYSLTADEYWQVGDTLFLVEKKHSRAKPIPSTEDMKDAFIKMALFANVHSAQDTDNPHTKIRRVYGVLGVTSDMVRGSLHSNMAEASVANFIQENNFSDKLSDILRNAITEAKRNGFCFFINNANDADIEKTLLLDFIQRQ